MLSSNEALKELIKIASKAHSVLSRIKWDIGYDSPDYVKCHLYLSHVLFFGLVTTLCVRNSIIGEGTAMCYQNHSLCFLR